MRYQAILFDFDGTLANDLSFFAKAYDYALKKYDIHLSTKEIASSCFGRTEEALAAKFNLSSAEEFRNYYFEGIRTLFVDVPLFPGVIETLEMLQKNNVKLGLISFARRWYIEMMLEQTGLKKYFQTIITNNDVANAKPDPEAIFATIKRLDVSLKETLSIGDSRGDMLMGKAAGCDNALFLPKENELFYSFDELRKFNSEYEFSTYEELNKILI
ncbi:MAG TPA: HAD-IA family hydrolase [Candidatus Saccharimonadales bacterium]|nr:HAD-IA family hydrolase [Candidatus Saccharimonadales bacterium]